MNKRGFVGDVFPIMLLLLMLAFIAVMMSMTLTAFKDGLAGEVIPQEATNIITYGEEGYPRVLDFWFVLFLVGLPLGGAILAYFNDVHPLYFWLSMFLIFVIVIMGASIAELWDAVHEDEDISVVLQRFPMMDFVLQHYGLYSFFCFVMISFGTFVKLRQGGGFYT